MNYIDIPFIYLNIKKIANEENRQLKELLENYILDKTLFKEEKIKQKKKRRNEQKMKRKSLIRKRQRKERRYRNGRSIH